MQVAVGVIFGPMASVLSLIHHSSFYENIPRTHVLCPYLEMFWLETQYQKASFWRLWLMVAQRLHGYRRLLLAQLCHGFRPPATSQAMVRSPVTRAALIRAELPRLDRPMRAAVVVELGRIVA